LNDLAARISNARISAQQAQTQQEQALERALAAIYGTGYTAPPPTDDGTEDDGTKDDGTKDGLVTRKVSPSITALTAIPVKASNTALQKRIDNFVAAKPNASPAAVAKEFPQLAAAIAKKKKK